MLRHLLAILILPANVLLTVPILLLRASDGFFVPSPFAFSTDLGVLAIAVGLSLMITTIRLFARVGRGTLAPWDPPKNLVVRGPYRRVRNPMISGVLFILLGEALLFRSFWLAGWWALFFGAGTLAFRFHEEPVLERRFGDDYRRYKKQVPRWLPRLVPVPASPPEGDG